MKLSAAIEQYSQMKRALGSPFITQASHLRCLLEQLGDVEVADISESPIQKYLLGSGTLTRTYHSKYSTVNGLFKFAIARGHASRSPLPQKLPKPPPKFEPYIYSTEELKALLSAVGKIDSPLRAIAPNVFRAVLLLLYGAAMRLEEALSLRIRDVDLKECVLRVNESKFNKTRLVPFGPKLGTVLEACASRGDRSSNEFIFVNRKRTKIPACTIEQNFRIACKVAGISRDGGPRRQPRLHDLRHTGAVHRVIDWYRKGKDVQKLLPLLSTYMGHAELRDTQVYLTVTPEIMNSASARFSKYALQEVLT
jgi:integrase